MGAPSRSTEFPERTPTQPVEPGPHDRRLLRWRRRWSRPAWCRSRTPSTAAGRPAFPPPAEGWSACRPRLPGDGIPTSGTAAAVGVGRRGRDRTVRDTARFYAEMERVFRPRSMPPMGEVTGPLSRRLRVGARRHPRPGRHRRTDTVDPAVHRRPACGAGPPRRGDDAAGRTGAVPRRLHLLLPVPGLHGHQHRTRRTAPTTTDPTHEVLPGHGGVVPCRTVLRRGYRDGSVGCGPGWRPPPATSTMLSPTVSTVPPLLGHLGANVDFEPLLERIAAWMPYTSLANAGGTPAISVPDGCRRGCPPARRDDAVGDFGPMMPCWCSLRRARGGPTVRPRPDRVSRQGSAAAHRVGDGLRSSPTPSRVAISVAFTDAQTSAPPISPEPADRLR